MTKILNRVGMLVSTTGQGTITAVVPVSNKFQTPAEAGAVDGEQYFWVLEEGDDFELFKGTWNDDDTISRDEVISSKIGGVAGTTKLTLQGGAILRSALPREGVAQGWTLIETIVASSGNSVVFDNIPDAYHDLYITGQNLDVTKSPGNTALQIDWSHNNGSTYSGDEQFLSDLNVGGGLYAAAILLGVQLPLATLINPGAISPTTALELSGRINAVKLLLDQGGGASSFTGPCTFKLYGR